MTKQNYTLNGINREALNVQLAAALGAAYGGFADQTADEGIYVTVYLTNAATQADINQLNALMTSYDPTALTPEQRAEQQRQQKLAQMREARTDDLDPADYSGEVEPIQALAERIAWLEQEILELRGGDNG